MKKIINWTSFNEKNDTQDWNIIINKLNELFQKVFIDENPNENDIKYYESKKLEISIKDPNERTCIRIDNKAYMYPNDKIGIIYVPCPDHYNSDGVTLQKTSEWKSFFEQSRKICEPFGFYFDFRYEIYDKNDEDCILYDQFDKNTSDPRFLCFYPSEIRNQVSNGLNIICTKP